jgi:drug/metabolite transporter (DMT)-like permease
MGFGIAAGGNWSGDGRLHAMHFPAHLLIPLTCGFIYVLGALCLKRAADGAGVWRATFVTNLAITIFVAPLWALGGRAHPFTDLWQPATTGLLFTLGQLLIYLAISRGDVSVTTPVMGTKSILVAALASVLFAVRIPPSWWWATTSSARRRRRTRPRGCRSSPSWCARSPLSTRAASSTAI